LSSASAWAAATAASTRAEMAASSAGAGWERGRERRGEQRERVSLLRRWSGPWSEHARPKKRTCRFRRLRPPAAAFSPLQVSRVRFQGSIRPAQALQVALQLVGQGLGFGGLGFQVGTAACCVEREGPNVWGEVRGTESVIGRSKARDRARSVAGELLIHFRGCGRGKRGRTAGLETP